MTSEIDFNDIVFVEMSDISHEPLRVGFVAGISDEGNGRSFAIMIFGTGQTTFVPATKVRKTGYRVDPASVYVGKVTVSVNKEGQGKIAD